MVDRLKLKGEKQMFLSRKNLNGGRRLLGFPLVEHNGMIGTKLGYCENCNEPILVKTIDRDEIVAHFWKSKEVYKDIVNKLEPKSPVKRRFIRWVIGLLGETPVTINDPVYN